MKKIQFWKMSGSGNDFVVIDNRRGLLRRGLGDWARRLCHRQEGVGADGLLLVSPCRDADFRMVYLNADGSRASMCGNGARCITWLALRRLGIGHSLVNFRTDAGSVKGVVRDGEAEITLGGRFEKPQSLVLTVPGRTYNAWRVNTGVPHVVIRVPNVRKLNVEDIAPSLRYHRMLGAAGANINFVERLSSRTLRVRTYERGVEAETLACGTGVMAAAWVGVQEGWVRPAVSCRTAGGDTLEVNFLLDGRVSLKGPVRLTFEGEFYV